MVGAVFFYLDSRCYLPPYPLCIWLRNTDRHSSNVSRQNPRAVMGKARDRSLARRRTASCAACARHRSVLLRHHRSEGRSTCGAPWRRPGQAVWAKKPRSRTPPRDMIERPAMRVIRTPHVCLPAIQPLYVPRKYFSSLKNENKG